MVLPKLFKSLRRLPTALDCPLCFTQLQSLQRHKSARIILLFCPNGTCRYAMALQNLPKPVRHCIAAQIFRRPLGSPRPEPKRSHRIG